MTTFKEIEKGKNIDLEIRKSGLSLAILFSKEFLSKFNLKYGDVIRLDDAEILRRKSLSNTKNT